MTLNKNILRIFNINYDEEKYITDEWQSESKNIWNEIKFDWLICHKNVLQQNTTKYINLKICLKNFIRLES